MRAEGTKMENRKLGGMREEKQIKIGRRKRIETKLLPYFNVYNLLFLNYFYVPPPAFL